MDPYKILGITPTAKKTEIKKAYRKLVMEHHPDHGGDEEKFKQINEAYSVLSNEKKKAEFDARRDGTGLGDFFDGFNPFGFNGPFHEIFKHKREESRFI